jgi:hypothetical protein
VWDGLARRSFDLGTTLGLSVGAWARSRTTGWELFAILTVVDRGELDDPSTQLPILDGGFDQTQLSLGVQHRFQPPDPPRPESGACGAGAVRPARPAADGSRVSPRRPGAARIARGRERSDHRPRG